MSTSTFGNDLDDKNMMEWEALLPAKFHEDREPCNQRLLVDENSTLSPQEI